jgi:hypothetical protein
MVPGHLQEDPVDDFQRVYKATIAQSVSWYNRVQFQSTFHHVSQITYCTEHTVHTVQYVKLDFYADIIQ